MRKWKVLVAFFLLCGCKPDCELVQKESEQVVTSGFYGYTYFVPRDWTVMLNGMKAVSPVDQEFGDSRALIGVVYDPEFEYPDSVEDFVRETGELLAENSEGDLKREERRHPLGRAEKYRLTRKDENGRISYMTHYELVSPGARCGMMCFDFSDDPDAFQDVFDRAFDTWRPES